MDDDSPIDSYSISPRRIAFPSPVSQDKQDLLFPPRPIGDLSTLRKTPVREIARELPSGLVVYESKLTIPVAPEDAQGQCKSEEAQLCPLI